MLFVIDVSFCVVWFVFCIYQFSSFFCKFDSVEVYSSTVRHIKLDGSENSLMLPCHSVVKEFCWSWHDPYQTKALTSFLLREM